MKIKYSNDNKKAWFNGFRFIKDNKTGYYLCSKLKKRLHRYVWEYFNGEIPEKYHIHHKIDKSKNDIEYLECILSIKHCKNHGEIRMKDKEFFNSFHEKGIEKAKEWHKSKEGHEWHLNHYNKTKDKLHTNENYTCEICNESFESIKRKNIRFCSNKCKSKWRRTQGIDNEKRNCLYCKKEFEVNKYRKTKYCSKSCSNRAVKKGKTYKNKVN